MKGNGATASGRRYEICEDFAADDEDAERGGEPGAAVKPRLALGVSSLGRTREHGGGDPIALGIEADRYVAIALPAARRGGPAGRRQRQQLVAVRQDT